MQEIYAVLTGDLVGSTKAGDHALRTSMIVASSVAREIGLWPTQQDTRFTRSRGDGWQMVLTNPAESLRAAIEMQARLRADPEGLATRISIGIGAIESLGTDDLSDASGPAFVTSGQGLDKLARTHRMTVQGASQTPLRQAILVLADEIARRWTREQAEALALAIHPTNPTLETMANLLQISKQAVNYRLIGAGLRPFRAALKGWEDTFETDLIKGFST